MAKFTTNMSGVEEQSKIGSSPVLPAGRYTVVIEKVIEKPSSKSESPVLNVFFREINRNLTVRGFISTHPKKSMFILVNKDF